MAAPAQKGTALLTKAPPVFSGYIVVGGSWSEKDAVQGEPTMNQDEETFNYTFWDPGTDAKCSLVTAEGTDAPKAGDVLTETGGEARKFLVLPGVETTGFGKRALKYNVSLMLREALAL